MMIRLIRVELLKIQTVRTTYGLLFTAVLLTGIFACSEASRAGNGSVASLSTASGLSSLTTLTGWSMLLAAVLGVIISSGEFRHSTATLTYLAFPDRCRVLAAKAATGAIAGAIFGLAGTIVATGIGIAFVAADGDSIALGVASLVGHAAGAVLGAALLAALGVAVGSLIRSQLAGIIGILIWSLAIEPIIGGLFTTIRPYLPYTAATTLAGAELGAGPGGLRVNVHNGSAVVGPLPAGVVVVLLAVLVIVLSAAAGRTSLQRDIS